MITKTYAVVIARITDRTITARKEIEIVATGYWWQGVSGRFVRKLVATFYETRRRTSPKT